MELDELLEFFLTFYSLDFNIRHCCRLFNKNYRANLLKNSRIAKFIGEKSRFYLKVTSVFFI